VTAGEKLQIDEISEMPDNHEWLLIMVVSSHAEKPYTGTQPITLTVKVAGDKGPIWDMIEAASDADTLAFTTAANLWRTKCRDSEGGSYSPCPYGVTINTMQHVGDGVMIYADTWVDGAGVIRAFSTVEKLPPYCNENYYLDVAIELSDDGRTVISYKGRRVCGNRGTDFSGTEFTMSEVSVIELRNVPIDEDFYCHDDGTCVHYGAFGAVDDLAVKLEWRRTRNGLLVGELSEWQFHADSTSSSVAVHFYLTK
jgi:hypothetical protein